MHPSLRDQIAGMARDVATPEQLETLCAGWDAYFKLMRITDEVGQEEEFNGIMRARVCSGSISLVAPNLKKELGLA